MKPIRLKELLHFVNRSCSDAIVITGYAIDSRKVKEGDLFFALKGKKVDGHHFLHEVALKGGVAAFVSEDYRGDAYGLTLIRVPDVQDALQLLAQKVLAHRNPKVVGITGSLGKTTTKEFAATFLKSRYKVFANPFSYNSQLTLPLNILSSDEKDEVLVLEMGMSEPGNISKLISIAPPDVAVVTTVAVQHANLFTDGLNGIAREKAAIFSHPKTTCGILHRDIHHFQEVFETGCPCKKTFSLNSKESDYFLTIAGDSVRIVCEKGPLSDIKVAFSLRAYYQNYLAAIAIARAFDISWEAISELSSQLKLPPMRFEKVEKQGVTFINDAYNANPDSMKAALEGIPEPKAGGKKIAILSEMDALGMYSEGGHALVAETALQYADVLLCIGERCETMRKIWKREKRPVELLETKEALQKKLQEIVKEGDVVLIKGARAYALEYILNGF